MVSYKKLRLKSFLTKNIYFNSIYEIHKTISQEHSNAYTRLRTNSKRKVAFVVCKVFFEALYRAVKSRSTYRQYEETNQYEPNNGWHYTTSATKSSPECHQSFSQYVGVWGKVASSYNTREMCIINRFILLLQPICISYDEEGKSIFYVPEGKTIYHFKIYFVFISNTNIRYRHLICFIEKSRKFLKSVLCFITYIFMYEYMIWI